MDLPNPAPPSRWHSSIELSAATWSVEEEVEKMDLSIGAKKSHILHKTDVLSCIFSCRSCISMVLHCSPFVLF